MLSISFPVNDCPTANHGVNANINGHPTNVKRDGDCLVYLDEEGTESRCKILTVHTDNGLTHYACASHGQEADDCTVLEPRIGYVNGKLKVIMQPAKRYRAKD